MEALDNDKNPSVQQAIEWMRANAPESIKDLPDKELIANMGDAYRRYTCDKLLRKWQKV